MTKTRPKYFGHVFLGGGSSGDPGSPRGTLGTLRGAPGSRGSPDASPWSPEHPPRAPKDPQGSRHGLPRVPKSHPGDPQGSPEGPKRAPETPQEPPRPPEAPPKGSPGAKGRPKDSQGRSWGGGMCTKYVYSDGVPRCVCMLSFLPGLNLSPCCCSNRHRTLCYSHTLTMRNIIVIH